MGILLHKIIRQNKPINSDYQYQLMAPKLHIHSGKYPILRVVSELAIYLSFLGSTSSDGLHIWIIQMFRNMVSECDLDSIFNETSNENKHGTQQYSRKIYSGSS